jgi:hypothetical protein
VPSLGPGGHDLHGAGLGRLPGDIVVRRDNFTLYFPIVTCLPISAVLSLFLWLVNR